MTSAPVRDPLADHLLAPPERGAAVHRLPARAAARVRSMDRALLVKNAVSTVKTIKTLRVPVVRSTVNVAAGRDSQPSPTSPAAYQLDHLPASRRFWPSPRSGDPAAG